MGQFAASFMQKGGEYFTPASIVKLIVEVIEPYHGEILDPACGSGGMFVHSAEFVRRHRKAPERELSVHGVEKMADTLRLARLNPGGARPVGRHPRGQRLLRRSDPHDMVGRFDYVMANPPFNQSEVDRARLGERGRPGGRALPLRPADGEQRQLPVDRPVLRSAQANRPRRLRDGQQRQRRRWQRARAAQESCWTPARWT